MKAPALHGREADGFYNEKAAARIAEVHPRTLRRWRERGLVAFYQTPTGRVRYKLEDLLEAVSEARVSANALKCPHLSSSAP